MTDIQSTVLNAATVIRSEIGQTVSGAKYARLTMGPDRGTPAVPDVTVLSSDSDALRGLAEIAGALADSLDRATS